MGSANAENAERVWTALALFGAPLEGLSRKDLTSPGLVFQIGVVPRRIDVMTSISGVDFDEAWANRLVIDIDEIPAPFVGRGDLIRNKRATGRPRDLLDVETLEERGEGPGEGDD